MSLTPRRFPEALAGRYRVHRRLGAGAMGAVFLVEDREVGDRLVAIKVTALEGRLAAELRERFLREARALAGLEHPAVLRVFDVGETEGLAYLVTEYLEGSSLERPVSGLDGVEAMLQVADGLDAVHAAGLVHRDLKPANVFWTEGGRAVLLDFGLVLDPGASAITHTGQAVGTPATMAPEVLLGKPAVPASDWYSWGATLYMILERRPMRGEAELYALLAGQDVPLPEFQAAAGDPRARGLIAAALTFDPEERLEAVRAARQRLASGAGPRPVPPAAPGVGSEVAPPAPTEGPMRRRWLLAGGLFAVGIWLGWPASAPEQAPGPSPTSASSPPPRASGVSALVADVEAISQGLEEALRRVPQSDDPARWGRVVAQLPALERLWARDLTASEDLAPGIRARLKVLDARFATHGLPRPFLVEPSPMPVPSIQEIWRSLQPHLPEPIWRRGLPPETTQLLQALERARVCKEDLEADLNRLFLAGEDPKGLQPMLVPHPALAESGARSILRMAGASMAGRQVSERWLRSGQEELRRLLRRTARLFPVVGGAEREGVVWLLRMFLGRESVWFYSSLASWPPEALVPHLTDDGPGAALRAMLHGQQRLGRRRWGEDWEPSAQALASWGRVALETDPAPGGEALGWAWRRRLLTDTLEGLVEIQKDQEARDLIRSQRQRLGLAEDQGTLRDLSEIMTVVWREAGEGAREEVDWLLEHLRPRKKSQLERLERDLGWALKEGQALSLEAMEAAEP